MFPVHDDSIGSTKYVSRSRALVLDNVDPEKLGRIRVKHPIIGESEWIPYLCLPGIFSVPEKQDIVYIEADAGFSEYIIAWGNLTKFSDNTLPEVFKRTTPSNRGIYSPEGHLIELDDGEDTVGTNKGIRVTSSTGNKISILEDNTATSGLITIETSGGAKLTIDGTSDIIDIKTNAGAELKLDTSGIIIKDSAGNEVAMTSSGVKITEVAGASLNLATNKVALGNSTLETVDVISQTLDFLYNAFTYLSTTTAPGFGAPISSVANFATLATQAQTLKTQVDSTLKGSL